MTLDPTMAGTVDDAVRAARSIDQPAFITVLDNEQRAALTAATAPTSGSGSLAGVPFAAKDNIDVAGVPSTAGCPTRVEPAAQSAFAVQRLIDAGAVPIGKTNMDQFATGLVGTRSPYGACHSVASARHVSGGSSSGSAVAVALGVVPLALGTDTAGSGRVPAAFNGIVGMKPSRGLVSNRGLLPACPSLDCITTLTSTVWEARTAFDALAVFDPDDPYARPMPVAGPSGVAGHMRVIAVPDAPLDMDDAQRAAWGAALAHAATIARVVPVDVAPFLAAARLLYGGPFVAERLAAFGALLEPDGPHLDPVVRKIVLGAEAVSGADTFRGMAELARLRRAAESVFAGADALLLPVTPGHPTLAEVAADPVGTNSALGTYTNMANLLDLCAIALPAGTRADGLPFGIQLLAPAFADRPLLSLAARWAGEPDSSPQLGSDRVLLAVAGAHLTGQPQNRELVELGGRLHARAATAGGYRMYTVPGPFPRPGLVHTGDGPDEGMAVEVWDLPYHGLGQLLPRIAPPLRLGQVTLDDASVVTGFLADTHGLDVARDITRFGGWRPYLASLRS